MIKYPIPKKLNYPITGEVKRNKYLNKKVLIDNITFDSLKEGNRYKELKLLEAKGIITDLQLQVKYELQPSYKINNKTIRSIVYLADFTYRLDNKLIIEDVKPSKTYQTEIYKLKKKLFMYKYNIEINEIY